MNRTSYLDKSMVALAVLLLCISGYLVMTIDDYLSRGTQKNLNDAIGSISHSSNDVRYRESSRIDRNRAQKKNAIFWNDSIFTGKKSKAKIDLKNGTKIKSVPLLKILYF